MVERSAVSFSELRQILTDLGFTCGKRGKFWYFEQPDSKTWFMFRPYRTNERVTFADLQGVRGQLDWHGILDERAFDDLLTKATA